MISPWMLAVAAAFGLCVGCIVMAIIADRTNKAETDHLQKEIYVNSVMYLQAVQTFEKQVEDKERELELKQRVMDSMNDELSRLRRINAQMKRQRKEGGEYDC